MKKLFKPLILTLLSPLAARLGYTRRTDTDFNKNSLLHTFYSTLVKINFRPAHIVDVGANHGTWTREALKYFPDARFTLLEPQARMRDSIKDILDTNPKVTFNAVGAGSRAGTFKFTIVQRDDSCSFAIGEDAARSQGFTQVDVPVVTLNDFLSNASESAPDIIKIDAEGLDLEVLKGASAFFGKTEVFMVEASVMNQEFDNSIHNVVIFMGAQGYKLFDITDLNRPFATPVLWLVELVFVKKGGFIDSQSSNVAKFGTS